MSMTPASTLIDLPAAVGAVERPAYTPGPISYGRLREVHPEYDKGHLRVLDALYRGGRRVLKDKEVLAAVFPKHVGETADSYRERCDRAYYVNHFGAVINFVLAGLAQDPVRLVIGEKPPPDESYWSEVLEDAGKPGGRRESLDHLIRVNWTRDALVSGWSWLRCDMPPAISGAANRLEQERAGELRGYFVHVPALAVTDWSERGDGSFSWVRVYSCRAPDDDPAARRDVVIHSWTVWDANGWAVYEVPIGTGPNGPQAPNDEEKIRPMTFGPHDYERVPFVRFVPSPGLAVGEALYSLCIEYMNQGNSSGWRLLRDSVAQLYEFNAAELPSVDRPISSVQEDPNRSRNQARGPGRVQVRGADDKAMYIAPPMDGAAASQAYAADLRDDIYRIVGQMALQQDTSGAMIRRSGDSKEMDDKATQIVLGAVGDDVRDNVKQAIDVQAAGIGDPEPPDVQGYARFATSGVSALVDREVQMQLVGRKSATWERVAARRMAKADVGDEATPSEMNTIADELEGTITQDQIDLRGTADTKDLERRIKGEPPAGTMPKPAPGTRPPVQPGK